MLRLMMILPFVIIIALIVALTFIFNKKQINIRWSRRIVVIYLIFLLLNVPIYYLITEPESEAISFEAHGVYDSHVTAPGQVFSNRDLEGLERADDKIVEEQWNFDYNEAELKISGDNAMFSHYITVREKEELDGEIRVASVATNPPSLSNPPNVSLSEGELQILHSQGYMVHLAPDFAATQFGGKGISTIESIYFHKVAEQLIYMEIPPELEVIEGDVVDIVEIDN